MAKQNTQKEELKLLFSNITTISKKIKRICDFIEQNDWNFEWNLNCTNRFIEANYLESGILNLAGLEGTLGGAVSDNADTSGAVCALQN